MQVFDVTDMAGSAAVAALVSKERKLPSGAAARALLAPMLIMDVPEVVAVSVATTPLEMAVVFNPLAMQV